MTQPDDQQRAAVETESRRCLVLAGAGSGKTRVLIERIAYLIEHQKISPYEIMAFSFTRKAAGEMKTRLQERIGNKAYHVTMGTMHALALGMIHRFGDLIGLRKTNVTVYGEWEEGFLLRDVAESVGVLKGKTWKIPKKEIDAMLDRYYQTGAEPEEKHPGRNLFLAFIQRCKENNSLTYGGLLTGLKLLIPELAKYLHIKHILVDEVQDIDPLQWQIIFQMEAAFNASLFVVGDMDQSIYEWRGAVPQYLLGIIDDGFDLYRLETNYRSVPEIVEASNKLIAHNIFRIPKTMRAAKISNSHAGVVGTMKDMDSERTLNLVPFFTCPVVILSRIHGLLEKIDRLMTEKEIPHVYIGKDTALTNSEAFRRFHAFLKLIVNPYDNFAFLLIRDMIGLSPEEYSSIRIKAAQEGKSHFQVWFDESPWDQDKWRLFFASDRSAGPIYQAELIENILGLSPESLKFISVWTEKNTKGTIQDYLDWLATYDIQDELKADEPQDITLMTIHACKGLEFPVVIVAGCNEGILPSKQALKAGDLEAERRLMYVAMTRAQDQLILTVRPESEENNGRVYESPISRFINEI